MGLSANSVSIVQFQVLGAAPRADLDRWLQESLQDRAFEPIDDTTEAEAIGWVNFEDNLSNDFSNLAAWKRDPYVYVTYRHDVRKAPGFLLRNLFQQESRKWLAEHPNLKRVPNQARQELREQIELSLRTRTLPSPTVVDLIWNTDNHLVTAATTSPKMMDQLADLFGRTFNGLKLVALHPIARAEHVLPEKEHAALYEANQAVGMDVATQIKANRWLGRDFLLWLLYRTRHKSGEYKVNQPGPMAPGKEFVAYLDEKLALVGEDEKGKRRTTLSGSMKDFAEARTGLSIGKELNEAVILFEKDEVNWKLTLKAELFAFASFTCPPVKIEKDETTDPHAEREAVFYERRHLMETGLQMFDSLLADYLHVRLDRHWETTHKKMLHTLEGAKE